MTVNILDSAMVIESVHRRSLWKIFRANGIPSHLVEIIKSFYDNFTCSVGDGDFLFEVDTGVRNGCVTRFWYLSLAFFPFPIFLSVYFFYYPLLVRS